MIFQTEYLVYCIILRYNFNYFLNIFYDTFKYLFQVNIRNYLFALIFYQNMKFLLVRYCISLKSWNFQQEEGTEGESGKYRLIKQYQKYQIEIIVIRCTKQKHCLLINNQFVFFIMRKNKFTFYNIHFFDIEEMLDNFDRSDNIDHDGGQNRSSSNILKRIETGFPPNISFFVWKVSLSQSWSVPSGTPNMVLAPLMDDLCSLSAFIAFCLDAFIHGERQVFLKHFRGIWNEMLLCNVDNLLLIRYDMPTYYIG